jgi:hypothetical protein
MLIPATSSAMLSLGGCSIFSETSGVDEPMNASPNWFFIGVDNLQHGLS